MPDFTGIGWLGWIIVGFFAGALSGVVVKDRSAGGCLANILIGILGGVVGGLLVRQFFPEQNQIVGWIGAFLVAFVGAVIVRWLLALVNGPRR
ncbi:MAG: GlsB/YeaQ/YmgE family stress response membrane protein [Chloroflexota bacterium]|nr:GlsB/YeaQ/YmgE family stress response membrane protein [Chloroflexota bacterium]